MDHSLGQDGIATNLLGKYLRDKRTKADPSTLGLSLGRRRTPGLRREEVAQRANISTAWYISLEQGRGGSPSADLLDRLAQALLLTDLEREHLFLIGLGRAPTLRYEETEEVEPRLQVILDSLSPSPALVKTAKWDVVAWNQAWATFVPGYATLSPQQRNMLRFCFLNPLARDVFNDWECFARYAVAVFRAESARAGALERVAALVDELLRLSPAFHEMWGDQEVLATKGATKRLRHPVLGVMPFESSTFAIDGRQDLILVVSSPVLASDAERIRKHIRSSKL